MRTCDGIGFEFRRSTHVSNGGSVEPSARYHVLDGWRAPAAE